MHNDDILAFTISSTYSRTSILRTQLVKNGCAYCKKYLN